MKVRALQLVAQPQTEAPDSVALAQLARGNVSALGEVYDRHAQALFRFATRLATYNDAEDLVQVTFLRVVKIAGTYDARTDTARSWLIGIMARIVQERRRSLARWTRALLRLNHGSNRTHGAGDYERTDIGRGLQKLSDAKRVVLILAEVEEYTCEEIANMLEIPVGTVWTRLYHARKELRAFYTAEGSA